MKRAIKKTLAVAMTAATLIAVPAASMEASAVDMEALQKVNDSDVIYIENHSVIDCVSYYVHNGYYYNFLIKVPNGASLNSLKIYDVYGDKYIDLNQLSSGYQQINFEYSNQDGDFYMFQTYVQSGSPSYQWKHFGIKLYYDNGDEHYMATNTGYNQTEEGSGYILTR